MSISLEPILTVKNLSVSFWKPTGMFRPKQLIKAVDNVSFEVGKSEFVSIVGESGSGKTTLARCLIGLQKPHSGLIKFGEDEVPNLGGRGHHKYLQDVQIVYQDPFESLNPRQDVFTTIATPLRFLAGEKSNQVLHEKVASLLQEVELDPDQIMYRLPHQLSGGQRQRVNIARALAPNPNVLIADEPISMLDAAQRLNILSLLVQLKARRGLTVIMITHELASARATSNRILVMYRGKIVEIGQAEAVLTRPHHPYVELILSVTPSLRRINDPQTYNIPSGDSIDKDKLNGCVFLPRCKYATEICGKAEPPLEQKSNQHYAACYNPIN